MKRGKLIVFLSIIVLVASLFFINSKTIDAQASQPVPGTITLSWTDTSSTETGFSIERQTASAGFSQIATVNANIVQYTDTSVQQLTTYQYRVAAYNAQGQSAYSNIVSVTTPAFVCGNGILQNGEQCDDGNVISGDGCNSICQTETTAPSNSGGGGGGGGGGGVTGNSVSTPPSNPPQEDNPAPEQSPENNPENSAQAGSSPTTGNAISEFLSDGANLINIAILAAIIAIAVFIYLHVKKSHASHVY